MIRVKNRWSAPLRVDFGPPLGVVRVPKTLTMDLDADFAGLKLPRRTAHMVATGTLEIEDLSAESPGEATGTAMSGAGAAGSGPAPMDAGTPTGPQGGGTTTPTLDHASPKEGKTTAKKKD